MPKIFKSLYFQVLVAIAIGVAVGHYNPGFGTDLKPLGDTFIKLIKMVIAPIIFCTVVVGIAGMEDMKKIGRVGGKALLYFELVTTAALAIGLLIVNLAQPGAGINADPATIDTKAIATYTTAAQKSQTTVEFLMGVIPTNVVDALAKGEILQVLFFAVLFGFALAAMGEKGRPLVKMIDQFAHGMFGVVNIIMKVAPIGAFGAMAFTIGKYGFHTLGNLALLMGAFYATCLLFIFGVIGAIARACGFSVWKFIKYIKEELLIVLGTSSSESALPRLMDKLERLGCSKPVVGLVVPTGYSFNLDGTSIYLTMAAIFIAQACNIDLTLTQELTILGVLMLTSKGAAGVTGSGFVTLAATLASIGTIPVAGLALILGIDRFMSEARALTNLIGNGVATIVIAKWEKELDETALHAHLDGRANVEAEIEADAHGERAPLVTATPAQAV
ncbi:dicarboxylate/amino acid:cation symporter [Plasticicumulans sp.]|uniref:dicarboxylate/amino acid:cation symporter n=1 Tax=Plasticicumulans sp. TaxID=2307179 RepID=UPI000FAB43CD|nr:dicarboxylate/amino acid:cation symporter [Plasticicumulans sp.]RTL02787.1 MAG: dicarboxylate/amino acid:cation symporter [Xanthomonadales bacterium]